MCEVSGDAGGTYHAKEVLDAAGVDGVQRRHFDAQQRVLWAERHAGGVERRVSCCWVPCVARRPVLVYADGGIWRAGGLAVGDCYVSVDRAVGAISGGNTAIGCRRGGRGRVCFVATVERAAGVVGYAGMGSMYSGRDAWCVCGSAGASVGACGAKREARSFCCSRSQLPGSVQLQRQALRRHLVDRTAR